MHPPWAATWIEHWPAAVQSLSFVQRGLALGEAQLRALGRRNGVAMAAFGREPAPRADEAELEQLATQLDALLQDLGGESAMVRLGSRSPKDTSAAVLGGLQVRSGREAVAALVAGSARVGFDLRVALQAGLPAWIFVREWVCVAWHEEWRGLVRLGELVAATQYNLALPLPGEPQSAASRATDAAAALKSLAAQLVPQFQTMGLDKLVFDLWLPTDHGAGGPRLIELNPWGPPTDSGLFRWEDSDLDGTLRWLDASGVQRRQLDRSLMSP